MAKLYQPQLWPYLLRLAKWRQAEFCNDSLCVLERQGSQKRWLVLDIEPSVISGWIWSCVVLNVQQKQYFLRWMSHRSAKDFSETFSKHQKLAVDQLSTDLQNDFNRFSNVQNKLHIELAVDRYLAERDRRRIIQDLKSKSPEIDVAYARACTSHAASFPITSQLLKVIVSLRDYAERLPRVLSEKNEVFIRDELVRYQTFFKYCEEKPLTNEQRVAIITLEENTLLIAAAGSGKTSTIVAKAIYLLARGLAEPKDIICLAFNRKAALEIENRIETRLKTITKYECPIDSQIKKRLSAYVGRNLKIESRTFHSFGKMVIEKKEGTHRKVDKPSNNTRRVQEAIEKCKQNSQFLEQWLMWQSVVRFARPKDSRFNSEKEYHEYLNSLFQQRKRGEGGADGIITLGTRDPVKSFEEVAISNWLYVMGVEFGYEVHFPEGAKLLNPGGKWEPDFTYLYDDGNKPRIMVHEHFALNAKGEAPPFFDNPSRYVKFAKHKQDVLRRLGQQHFWTTSADYISGNLFKRLESQLRAYGVRIQPRSAEEITKRLIEIGQEPDNDLIERAVSQIRQNGWTHSDLQQRLAEQVEPVRAKIFLQIVWPVVETVNQLVEKSHMLDFDEMMRRSLAYLQEEPDLFPFKHILVDEFQDTSPGRAEMLRKVLRVRNDRHFFVVGDDWQAINRFAGSDLSYFTKFSDKFNKNPGADSCCALTETFRCNQGIADIARGFILKNKSQISKKVVATDKTRQGVINVRTYHDKGEVMGIVEQTLEQLLSKHPGGEKPTVFLLGRYGDMRAAGLNQDQIKDINNRWGHRINLHKPEKGDATIYLTMHSSKGLQADYVLVAGMFSATYNWLSFPSEREDDPLLQLVLPPKEALSDADERRLFYVALTRARHQVVLLVQEQHPSPYALELLRDYRDGSVHFNSSAEKLPEPCPACKTGLILSSFNRTSSKELYACSDRWRCGKTWLTKPATT